MAQLGRQWNNQNPSQPNQVYDHVGRPVQNECKSKGIGVDPTLFLQRVPLGRQRDGPHEPLQRRHRVRAVRIQELLGSEPIIGKT